MGICFSIEEDQMLQQHQRLQQQKQEQQPVQCGKRNQVNSFVSIKSTSLCFFHLRL